MPDQQTSKIAQRVPDPSPRESWWGLGTRLVLMPIRETFANYHYFKRGLNGNRGNPSGSATASSFGLIALLAPVCAKDKTIAQEEMAARKDDQGN